MKRTALVCVRSSEGLSVSRDALGLLRYRVVSAAHPADAASAILRTQPDVLVVSPDHAAELLEMVDGSTVVLVTGDQPAFVMARDTGVPESQCIELPATRADFVNALAWAETKPVCA